MPIPLGCLHARLVPLERTRTSKPHQLVLRVNRVRTLTSRQPPRAPAASLASIRISMGRSRVCLALPVPLNLTSVLITAPIAISASSKVLRDRSYVCLLRPASLLVLLDNPFKPRATTARLNPTLNPRHATSVTLVLSLPILGSLSAPFAPSESSPTSRMEQLCAMIVPPVCINLNAAHRHASCANAAITPTQLVSLLVWPVPLAKLAPFNSIGQCAFLARLDFIILKRLPPSAEFAQSANSPLLARLCVTNVLMVRYATTPSVRRAAYAMLILHCQVSRAIHAFARLVTTYLAAIVWASTTFRVCLAQQAPTAPSRASTSPRYRRLTVIGERTTLKPIFCVAKIVFNALAVLLELSSLRPNALVPLRPPKPLNWAKLAPIPALPVPPSPPMPLQLSAPLIELVTCARSAWLVSTKR